MVLVPSGTIIIIILIFVPSGTMMIIIIISLPSRVPWNQNSSYPTDEQLIAVKTSNDSSNSLETLLIFVCVFQLNTKQIISKYFCSPWFSAMISHSGRFLFNLSVLGKAFCFKVSLFSVYCDVTFRRKQK